MKNVEEESKQKMLEAKPMKKVQSQTGSHSLNWRSLLMKDHFDTGWREMVLMRWI